MKRKVHEREDNSDDIGKHDFWFADIHLLR